MNETILTIVFVAFVTGIFSFSFWRKRNEVWDGIVVDKKKKRHEDDQGFVSETAVIFFKTNEGKKKKLSGNAPLFDKYEIGDKVKKVKGEYYPERI